MVKDEDGTNDREVLVREQLVREGRESYLTNENLNAHEPPTPSVERVGAGGATMTRVVGIAAYRAQFPTATHIADHLSGVPGAVSRAVLARAFVKEALERAVDELHTHRDVDRATEVAVNRMAGYQHRLLLDKGRTPPSR